jgi:hypothetical protein
MRRQRGSITKKGDVYYIVFETLRRSRSGWVRFQIRPRLVAAFGGRGPIRRRDHTEGRNEDPAELRNAA